LLAVDKQVMPAVMFLKDELGAVGEFGFGEGNPGFHVACDEWAEAWGGKRKPRRRAGVFLG
jgi:hypothetical protein